jgi:hypothetical protein
MLGKIVGAVLGAKASKNVGSVSEPGGALLGVAAMTVARRFGLPGMIAAAVGGYALKRYQEKRQPVANTPAR